MALFFDRNCFFCVHGFPLVFSGWELGCRRNLWFSAVIVLNFDVLFFYRSLLDSSSCYHNLFSLLVLTLFFFFADSFFSTPVWIFRVPGNISDFPGQLELELPLPIVLFH